jgi:hypothetical protein
MRLIARSLAFLTLLFPIWAGAQVTVGYTNWNGVQSGTAVNTTIATTSGTTQTSGSLFIALVSNQSGVDSTPTVTDNKGNNSLWTLAHTVSMFSQQDTTLFYCINCAGGSGHVVTATWGTAATLASIGLVEFTSFGAATVDSNPTGFFNSSGNSPTAAPSITTTVANELVINAWSAYSGGAQTVTDSAGWTNAVKYQTGTYQPGSISYRTPASSGTAVSDSFSYSAFGYSGALSLSIKTSGGGGSCTHNFWKSTGTFAQPDGSTGSYWNLATGAFSTPNCSTGTFWRQDGASAAN